MTDRDVTAMDCATVDELAGAVALGAAPLDELAAVRRHLTTCDEPHAELHELLGAGALMGSSLEPVEPAPALRARVMASVAAPGDREVTRSWWDWSSARPWRLMVAAAAVVVLVVGTWGLGLRQQVATQEAALSAIAEAVAGGAPAHPVTGSAGSGYVIDTAGPGATFLVAGLETLPGGELYEMWLIDAAGTPLAVGTITDTDAPLAVATLEQDLGGFAAFAVTVETEAVAAPTTDPVMLGSIN